VSTKNERIALITGGAKRLGKSLAESLLSHGWEVALHYNTSQKEAESLQGATPFKADLQSVSDIESMVTEVIKKFGRIDALINNAAIFFETPFGDITEDQWDPFLNTNLKGPFFCAQAVANQMKKQKNSTHPYHIINITDSGGPKTRGNYLPYWISKEGLRAMTETLAKVLAPDILVNAVAPGPILFPEDQKRLKNQTPIDPREIAEAVHYLLGGTRALTGNTLIIDGGRRYR
jgi:pteridine reductase